MKEARRRSHTKWDCKYHMVFEVAPVCGQLGGLFKVYSGCRSSCQNLLGSIFLSPLLRRWVSGQGA